MHQMRKGFERLCSRTSAVPLRLGKRCATTKSTGPAEASTGKGLRSPIQKSSASTATASQPVRRSEDDVDVKPRMKGVPLDVPFPGVSMPSPDNAVQESAMEMTFNTEVTTLDSGLKVGSSHRFGKYCTIGVTIKSGSRYETGFTSGISHVAEKLGFLSSQNFETKAKIMKELEKFGAICDSQTSRDTTVYAISTEVNGVESLIRLLADVILRPQIKEEELANAKQTVQFEIEDMQMRPEQELTILEMIHSAAWNNNTLGFPRYCPQETAEKLSREEILKFMKSNYTPNRMSISGVGVDHKLLVDLAKEYFVTTNTTWDAEGIKAEQRTDPVSVYTGGDNRVLKDFGQFNAGPLPVPKLAHMALGVKSVSYSDQLFIPACVLNILMGGGGSFSAGGPGKGMYSRLYTNVLNNKHWVYNATAYNNSYADGGLFCIYASAPPEYMRKMTEVLIQELHGMAKLPQKEEFQRAKKQLQSMLLMNLESRPIVFEDIGRQLLAHGYYKPPTEYLKQIELVTESDVVSLAKSMLQSKPCLAALGDISSMPAYEEILNRQGYLREPSKMYFSR